MDGHLRLIFQWHLRAMSDICVCSPLEALHAYELTLSPPGHTDNHA